MTENLKKLTGKYGYEPVVRHLVNDCDVELFKELTEKDDFLFDFVKQNVAQRIAKEINNSNYKNLIEFLKYYSPSYEDVIVSNLVKYADEDLTDIMLEKFENGTDDEKAYCAKFFGYVQDSLAHDFLVANSYSDFEYLQRNCAISLAQRGDRTSYQKALSELLSADEFEKLSAVKFLVAYGDKDAVKSIIDAMKTSAMAENIAGEIPYLKSIKEILDENELDGLLVLNSIINGLGEILPLGTVFDYELFDIFEKLVNDYNNGSAAVVLLNAKEKFETLTENDEYLFDEDKDVKNEVYDIKKLLNSADKKELLKFVNGELKENNPFVFTALDFAIDAIAVRELLKSENQTLILKTAEVLKKLGYLDETAKTVALGKVTDLNIKSIIRAL